MPLDPGPPQPTLDPYASPLARLEAAGVSGGELPIASAGSRLVAKIVDNLLYAVAWVPFGVALVVAIQTSPELGPEEYLSGPVVLASLLLSVILSLGIFGLTVAMWVSAGQSPGKRLIGLRIVREDGAQADAMALVGRRWGIPTLIRLVLACGGANSLFDLVDALMIFSERGRTVHDRIAGTVVVDARWEPPEVMGL